MTEKSEGFSRNASALDDICICGHHDHEHLPAEGWRCSICVCNAFDWDIDKDTPVSDEPRAAPPAAVETREGEDGDT